MPLDPLLWWNIHTSSLVFASLLTLNIQDDLFQCKECCSPVLDRASKPGRLSQPCVTPHPCACLGIVSGRVDECYLPYLVTTRGLKVKMSETKVPVFSQPQCWQCRSDTIIILKSVTCITCDIYTSLCRKKQKLEFCLVLLGALADRYGDPAERFSNL